MRVNLFYMYLCFHFIVFLFIIITIIFIESIITIIFVTVIIFVITFFFGEWEVNQ